MDVHYEGKPSWLCGDWMCQIQFTVRSAHIFSPAPLEPAWTSTNGPLIDFVTWKPAVVTRGPVAANWESPGRSVSGRGRPGLCSGATNPRVCRPGLGPPSSGGPLPPAARPRPRPRPAIWEACSWRAVIQAGTAQGPRRWGWGEGQSGVWARHQPPTLPARALRRALKEQSIWIYPQSSAPCWRPPAAPGWQAGMACGPYAGLSRPKGLVGLRSWPHVEGHAPPAPKSYTQRHYYLQ